MRLVDLVELSKRGGKVVRAKWSERLAKDLDTDRVEGVQPREDKWHGGGLAFLSAEGERERVASIMLASEGQRLRPGGQSFHVVIEVDDPDVGRLLYHGLALRSLAVLAIELARACEAGVVPAVEAHMIGRELRQYAGIVDRGWCRG